MVLTTLKLLIPVFIPSWQFFNKIAPSPRIEFSLMATVEEQSCQWQEFCLRPKQLSITSILKSIFYNPRWNESLFITTCAERLITNPTEQASQEIIQRIKSDLEQRQVDLSKTPYLQFRLVFVSRQGSELQEDILYISEIQKLEEPNHEPS
ncbi:MAG: hypothetical protein O3C63_07905 [Cyanobacteria bacterium]|nr:hypothetical protein [Cyanobacteriota bacterium]MDA1020297.1 hypothetical protein [Cyanobacteriota bacterium]